MNVAGIDYSTKAVDVVLLDEDTDAATWHRFPLIAFAGDAFDRTRHVREAMPGRGWWEDQGVVAVGIEDPRGARYSSGVLYRVQGAILACLPTEILVQPWDPKSWRVKVGLPGNSSKQDVAVRGMKLLPGASIGRVDRVQALMVPWGQDAYDALCIAHATRDSLEREAA